MEQIGFFNIARILFESKYKLHCFSFAYKTYIKKTKDILVICFGCELQI